MLSCPICKETIKNDILERFTFKDNTYKLSKCKNCGLEFWYPLIMPDRKFYEEDTEIFHEPSFIRHTIGNRKLGSNHKNFFKQIQIKNGLLLDIGCGDGLFLYEAQKAGYEVWGIDMDKKAVEVAKKRGLKNIYSLSLNNFKDIAIQNKLKFDIVTFFEVLEHQTSPNEFMMNIKKLLRNGGWIAGSVPNRDRFKSKTDKLSDKPPYHFTRWDSNTIMRFLGCHNYVNLLTENVGLGYFLPKILKNANLKIKNLMLKEFKENKYFDNYSLEEIEELEVIRYDKLENVKKLKIVKNYLLFPFFNFEKLYEKIFRKSYFIYFQANI